MKKILMTLALAALTTCGFAGDRYNFNAGWKIAYGKETKGSSLKTDDSDWRNVTLPYAFNQEEAFSRLIDHLTDTVCWYRKTFRLAPEMKGKRVFVEFEGIRQGARCFLNGKELGWSDNGIMAFGFDLTPLLKQNGDNIIALRVDNDWKYKEHFKTFDEKRQKEFRSGFQWNDRNFYANYGGINKRVWLHVMNDVYQTLPLYSNLGTTGVYVYAKDINVKKASATIHAESQVVNASTSQKKLTYEVIVQDADGKQVASFKGAPVTIQAGDTTVVSAEKNLTGLHFWSWGYGYLYTVKTRLVVDGNAVDEVSTRTGFRKTAFKDGMFYLNDRVLQLKGFAQRSTNEWPAVGISVPAWMSDYSNRLVLGCNGNFYRWMHVTPGKQDVESFDRLGLIQAMPAGDSEKDVDGRRWEQRVEVMRDAIIYNRNNPSVIFYEGGNNQISEEHMQELKALRDQYDPFGGRASGSRNMLDSKVAEYGGEMLYINKSAAKPMWQMEYNRDEGIRRYWDKWSYPYHVEGEGPAYRGDTMVVAYNHNQDGLAVENVVRWNEYWMARPGTGRRVNSGGAKIIFSDSNTHARGEKNYRTSGDVDAMRIEKDSYFAHQVMWNGWVDNEQEGTYIIGHWNYDRKENGVPAKKNYLNAAFADLKNEVVKPVYVVSTGDEVELLLNGKSLGKGERTNTFLFTFNDVKFVPGKLEAVSYKNGREVSRAVKETVGKPVALKLTWVDEAHAGNFLADGNDIRIAQIEAVDKEGRRHPIAHDQLSFSVSGPAEYLGGLSGDVADSTDNRVLSKELSLEAGVCRVMLRSTTTAGNITLQVKSKAYKQAELKIASVAAPVKDGFYVDAQGKAIEADRSQQLPLYLQRGATPATPSYKQQFTTVAIKQLDAASAKDDLMKVCDDDEHTKWTSDGKLENSWLKVTLERPAAIAQIAFKMDGFRRTSFPIEIYAGEQKVWEGYTDKSLGYCYAVIDQPVKSDVYTIRMVGPATVKEAFGSMTELAAKKNVSTKASKSNRLSIIEVEFNEKAK